jgi:hypothetical protein
MTNGDVLVPIVCPKDRTPTPIAVTTTATVAAITSRRRSQRDTVATLWHPAGVRRLFALALAGLTLAGCGSATVEELPPGAAPERGPGTLATIDNGRLRAVLSPRARVLRIDDARTGDRVDQAPAGVGPTRVVGVDDRLYVADTRGEALLIYHVRPRLTLTRRVSLPGAPSGLALDRARRRLWVTLTASDELVGLTADRTAPEVARLPTIRRPEAVSVDSASGTVTVTGRADAVQRIGADEAYGEDHG